MTHDDDLDQPELRELLAQRAQVGPNELEPLRRFVAALPPRRRSRGRGILAVAAGIVVLLAGAGALAILTVPWGSSGAAPSPPNPAYFANDPRLAVCNAKASDAVAIFELKHLSDYAAQLPNAYPLVGLQADPSDPALVIVFGGQGSADREGGTPPPGSHDLCLVVGADAKHWQQLGIVAVDTTGLEAFKPEPTGTPIAADLLPWVNACGGASAGINRVLQLPHGTDAMTLNSVQVPISLMTDAPMTIVVYDGAHPFAPLGTPPAGAASVAPRQPGYQDLCILVGSDPATAVRTIVEVGPSGEITDLPGAAPSGGAIHPSPSTAPTSETPTSDAPSGSVPPASPGASLRPEINAANCAALGLSDARCAAVVEVVRIWAGIDWSQVTAVNLMKPSPDAIMGSRPLADVTFTLRDGNVATRQVRCGIVSANMPWCTDHPEVKITMPYGPAGSGYAAIGCDLSGKVCSTPLPTINPTAKSVPLTIAAHDYPLVVGRQEILVGQATLPNGILSDGHFSLADVSMGTFVAGTVELVVRSTDPSRPDFANLYDRGWHPGSEVVNVYLVVDVLSITPGATLQVRDLVVR